MKLAAFLFLFLLFTPAIGQERLASFQLTFSGSGGVRLVTGDKDSKRTVTFQNGSKQIRFRVQTEARPRDREYALVAGPFAAGDKFTFEKTEIVVPVAVTETQQVLWYMSEQRIQILEASEAQRFVAAAKLITELERDATLRDRVTLDLLGHLLWIWEQYG